MRFALFRSFAACSLYRKTGKSAIMDLENGLRMDSEWKWYEIRMDLDLEWKGNSNSYSSLNMCMKGGHYLY